MPVLLTFGETTSLSDVEDVLGGRAGAFVARVLGRGAIGGGLFSVSVKGEFLEKGESGLFPLVTISEGRLRERRFGSNDPEFVSFSDLFSSYKFRLGTALRCR